MDEYILLNYFTKIGKSFYESKDFNSDLDFTAISRFGIGILSCFMVANKVEISTKKEGCEAIRFSIKSLYSYFVTQLENKHRNVEFFPSLDKKEKQKYRKDIGTSLALQIDFNMINYWFELEEELEKHIFYSPIEIKYKDKKIGTVLEDLDKNPWASEKNIVELTEVDDRGFKDFFELNTIKERVKLQITPIDLSQYSITKKIKGQMVLIEVLFDLSKFNDNYKREVRIEKGFSFNNNSLELRLNKTNIEIIESTESFTIELSNYREFKLFEILQESKVGYNGIFIAKDFSDSLRDKLASGFDSSTFALSYIYLSNEFRPALDLSRSKGVEFDYKTILTVNLMMSKFITANDIVSNTFDCSLVRNRFSKGITYNQIINDNKLLDSNLEEWKNEKIFLVDQSIYVTFNEIKKIDKETKVLNYPRLDHFSVDYIYKSHTRKIFVLILISLFTKGYVDKKGNFIIEKTLDKVGLINNEKYFQVGFFSRYEEEISRKLQLEHNHVPYSVNIRHNFSQWLLKNAEKLDKKYKGIFEDIKSQFIHKHHVDNEKFIKLKSLLQLLQKLDPNFIDNKVIRSIEDLD